MDERPFRAHVRAELGQLLESRTGDLFRLSSLHGQKVLLLAWASW